MSIQALTGADVITLNGTVFNDLAFGDSVLVDIPNDIGTVKTGKNGNSILAFNASGLNAKVAIRLIAGSTDDKTLNSKLAEWVSNPVGFVTMTGSFKKKLGDGAGNTDTVIYDLSGGIFSKLPTAKENVEGDSEQAVVVWNLIFSNVSRSIA